MNVYNKTSGVKQVEIQARTELATNVNGTKVNATVFSGFAMKEFASDTTAQVEISNSTKEFILWWNQEDITLDFQASTSYSKTGSISVFRKSNATEDPQVSFIFSSGIDLTVTLNNGILAVSLSIPDDVKENIRTDGLQGNIDGDPNNDLQTPNGTVLSINSTEEEIFDNFGQLWAVNQSLFIYPAGQTKDDYAHPSFRPLFLNKTSASYQKALQVCGNEENVACIYDFIATENEALAENTNSVAQSAREDSDEKKYSAPEINGTSELFINVNETASWELFVTDKDNDTVRIQVEEGSDYVNVTQNGNNFTLGILIPNLQPVNISVAAIDSRNSTSAEFSLKVILCSGCSGNGKCNESDVVIEQQFYEELQCTCEVGYDGKNCELDYNGCSQDPCDLCTDLSPTEQQALNRTFNCSCPSGYALQQDNRCMDIDECAQNHSCAGTCVNTEGNFTCTCPNGYEPENKFDCINIDECDRKTDDCEQLCNDTTPGYNCSCYNGYKLKADNISCEIDNTVPACTIDCSNATGCTNNNCFCNKGFALNSTNFCVDVDECEQNPCEGTCKNTNGSFYCECQIGKKVVDKTKCETCDDEHWGTNCTQNCNCSVNAKDCDSITGCICQEGWKGIYCSEDINECQGTNNCSQRQNCINSNGSYECVCLNGFEREGIECIDEDECQIPNICPYECENSVGSYTCTCPRGYSGQNGTNCTDIDECKTNSHGCEQICTNNLGSFSCDCVQGYKLSDDRKTCSVLTQNEACKNANCTDTQYCNYTQGIAKCNCKNNYEFDSQTNTCTVIDLCVNNPCKNGSCSMENNMIACNCTTGYSQVHDNCQPCKSIYWGDNCKNTCDCVRGTCNNIKGCICFPGYEGIRCEGKINYCLSHTCDNTSSCKSLETNYTCECNTGYENPTTINGTCLPCRSNYWGENCINTCDCVNGDCNNVKGCVCDPGYKGVKCQEKIDYCINSTCDTNSTCKSLQTNYTCECNTGYENATTINGSCTPCRSNYWGENCNNTCDCVSGECNNVKGCVCDPGYKGLKCQEKIDYCINSTCDTTSICKSLQTNYTCECNTGYENATTINGSCTRLTTTPVETTEEVTTPSETTVPEATTVPETTVPIETTQQETSSPIITTTIKPNFIFEVTLSLNVTFPADNDTEAFKADLRQSLIALYRSIPGFIAVFIIDLSKGSVVAVYDIHTKEHSGSKIMEKTNEIKTYGLTFRNQTVLVLSFKESLCKLGCTTTVDDNFVLELGLGLGLSIPIVIIIMVTITIWFRGRSKKVVNLDDSDVFNTAQSYGSVSSLLQGKHLALRNDFLRASGWSQWEEKEYNENTPGMPRYYDHPVMAEEFKIQRPCVR